MFGGPPLPPCWAAVLSLAAPLVIACHRGADHGPPRRPPVPVVIGETERRDVPETLSAVGTIQPFVTVAVRPLVTGAIVNVLFREGEEVRQGQQLFQVDPRPYEAALAQARANLGHARDQAANARADARRYAELVKKEYVTEQQYQTALANAASLRADVAAAGAAVRKAALDLENCRIDAPITGRTGADLVQLGNVVQANQANPLVVIAQTKPISVAFTVPEVNVGALRQGVGRMQVVSDLPGGPPREGTLAFVNNTSDPAAGTIFAKATYPNEDEALWPGQFVNVRVLLDVQRGAIVAPASAVVTGQSGSYVYVVKEDMTVEQRPVKVARADADRAVIAQGVGPGERVVVDGQLGLEPGSRVAPRPPVGPAGGQQPQPAQPPAQEPASGQQASRSPAQPTHPQQAAGPAGASPQQPQQGEPQRPRVRARRP